MKVFLGLLLDDRKFFQAPVQQSASFPSFITFCKKFLPGKFDMQLNAPPSNT
jgi:hypothetical protein